MKNLAVAILGRISWMPPDWVLRIGVRKLARNAIVILAVSALLIAGFLHYLSLPKPPQVEVEVTPPQLSAVVDGTLVPDVLRLDLSYPDHAEAPTSLSAARIDLIGETITEGIEMQPPMAGEWRFTEENRLYFHPRDDWPAGQTYRVSLDSALFAPGLKLADWTPEFTTPAFTASIDYSGFYQHPERVKDRRVIASFSFSHPVDRAKFEERVHMSLREALGDENRRELETSIEYGPADRTAHVQSEILSVPDREQFVTVTARSGVAPVNGDRAHADEMFDQVRIPDQSTYFRVSDVSVSIVRDAEDTPFQTVMMRFTDQVDTDDFATHVQAWLLPNTHRIGLTTDFGYQWRSASEVTPEVLAVSQPLALAVAATERSTSDLQSFTFDAPEGRYIYLRIAEELTSKGGFHLASGFDDVDRVPEYPKEARIAGEGSLLPLTGKPRLSLTARGVSAIKVEIQQMLPDTLNHLASQTRGDIRDPWFGGGMDADDLSELTTQTMKLKPAHPRERLYATLDLEPYLPAGGLFYIKVQGWDTKFEHAVGPSDRRMALVTDLGLLVKSNLDKSQDVFVHSIASGEPVAGAAVEVLGRNGLAIASAVTDRRGHAGFGSVAHFKRGQTPSVFVVRKNQDATFLPYERTNRKLNWSAFDTGGIHIEPGDEDRLKAALYTDRGLYRPGEAVQLFGVVLRGDFGRVPGTPVELRISDPRGNTALFERTRLTEDGLVNWPFATRLESPTGTYRADVFLIDDHGRRYGLGGTSFDVEDYQPDRLRIHASIMRDEQQASSEQGWLQPGTHHARVQLENLFGTPAQDRTVRATLKLTPVSPAFQEYPGFVFTDPFRDPETPARPVTLELNEAKTGEDGKARLDFNLRRYVNGIYRLLLTAEGFESGGVRSVRALDSTLLSPAEILVGYRVDGELDFIHLNSERSVRFLAINRDAVPIAVDGLQAILYERRFVSTLVRKPNGSYGYQSVVKEHEINRRAFQLSEQGSRHALATNAPGRYALEIVDANGVKLSRVEYAVAGAGNIAGNLERNAELDVKLDRREYRPGDEILLQVTAPYAGTGLVTIESDRVHAFAWFQSDTSTTMTRIRLPPGIEGNAYVNVALIRDIHSEEIFVSPLSYAAVPFAIDRAARRVDIDLSLPERTHPGQPLEVEFSTTESTRLVLFAVDEGILQVADYRTPDPLERFLAKRALQVGTHQMVDLILPAYELLRPDAAPGGDDRAVLLKSNLNPFRRRSEHAVALWAGIHESGPSKRGFSFDIPDYFNGELRVMAVAVGEGKLGARAASVTVRGPMTLTPNLPLAVVPGDRFAVSVGVANNVEGSGDDAEILVSSIELQGLNALGGAEHSLKIAENSEGRATFDLEAGTTPGKGAMELVARLGNVSAARRASLSIRPATPYETSLVSGHEVDGRAEIAIPRQLYRPFSEQQISVSRSPLVLAEGLMTYLKTFPHECVEQAVSRMFPQLGLARSGFLDFDRAAYQLQFKKTLERLRARQNTDGGFRFWMTSENSAFFASVYVTHFLIAARQSGFPVPEDMLQPALTFLQRIAGDTQDVPHDELLAAVRTRAYAAYLLTRAGMVTTNYLSALQALLTLHFEADWRSDLASAYLAASHALLKNQQLASSLIYEYRMGEASHPDTDFDTQLARDAQYLYLLGHHFPDAMAEVDAQTIRQLVRPLFENRFNTLSGAYMVLALGEIHLALTQQGAAHPITIKAYDRDGPIELDVKQGGIAYADLPTDAERVRIENESAEPVYYTLSQSGFDRVAPTERLAGGLEIDRAYFDAKGNRVSRVRIGDELTVRLRVRSQQGRIPNVAVTDLLPGGFEIVTESIRDNYSVRTMSYHDLREDRLVLYADFDEQVTEISYRIKATAPGEFAAPAAHADAMYHRSIRGRSAPGRLTVEGA